MAHKERIRVFDQYTRILHSNARYDRTFVVTTVELVTNQSVSYDS